MLEVLTVYNKDVNFYGSQDFIHKLPWCVIIIGADSNNKWDNIYNLF